MREATTSQLSGNFPCNPKTSTWNFETSDGPPGCRPVARMGSMRQSSTLRRTLAAATALTCKLKGLNYLFRLGNRLEKFVGDFDEMDCQCAVERNRLV